MSNLNKQDKKSLAILAGLGTVAFAVSFPITSVVVVGVAAASGYGIVHLFRVVTGNTGHQ